MVQMTNESTQDTGMTKDKHEAIRLLQDTIQISELLIKADTD